jgi:hypothetical protein
MTTTDDLRRLNDESRARLAAVRRLQEQNRFIVRQSRRRVEECWLLLDRTRVPGRV